jgi:predicted acylesterase/phospholipase RssA
VAGGAYHFGTLTALEMATGWDPDDAEVIVGTSSGAFVAAMVRGKAMDFQSMADASLAGMDLADWLHSRLYRRIRPRGLARDDEARCGDGSRHPGRVFDRGARRVA